VIVREGTVPAERVYETTCTSCGTVYRYRHGYTMEIGVKEFASLCPLEGCGVMNFHGESAYVFDPKFVKLIDAKNEKEGDS